MAQIRAQFGSYFFLAIAHNDSLLQCLTSSRGKTHGPQIWAKRAKIELRTRFLDIFSSLVH